MRSGGNATFAQFDRFKLEPSRSPGPKYWLPGATGKQVNSTSDNPPAWPFSSAARTKVEPGMIGPGPAGYTLSASVGPQPDSRKPRAATPGFGASTRDIRATIYLGPEFEKGAHGKLSPGPFAPYTLCDSVGKQVHSKTGSAPGVMFSRASRWASYEKEIKSNSTPGPGAY